MVAAVQLFVVFPHGTGNSLPTAELCLMLTSGVVAATSMGLFVGRLESRFLKVHTLELVALYLYAGIQPLFRYTEWITFMEKRLAPSDDLGVRVELVVKVLALVLKLGLYGVVRRQLLDERLDFYMLKVRVLHPEMTRAWEAFKRDRRELPESVNGGAKR